MDDPLYRAILQRRSVRRYDKSPLDADTLQRVRDLVAATKPLVPENPWQVLYQDDLAREDWSALFGAYGGILTPPHVLGALLVGQRHPLTDLGYRAEQLAVGLTALGLGSCFVGTFTREARLRERLGLPQDAQIGALLVYGRATTSLAGKGVNSAMRALAGAANKLSLERLCFLESFDQPRGASRPRCCRWWKRGAARPRRSTPSPGAFCGARGAAPIRHARQQALRGRRRTGLPLR